MVSCTAETQQAVSEIRQAFSSLLEGFQFAFVVSNPREPDNPIVYASPSFFELTGYSPAEVLGRNCRFLQGGLSAVFVGQAPGSAHTWQASLPAGQERRQQEGA